MHCVAGLLYTAFSRKDEFVADAYASDLLGGPDKILHVLCKLFEVSILSLGYCSKDDVYKYFTTPSDTHPSVKDRIVALSKLKKE